MCLISSRRGSLVQLLCKLVPIRHTFCVSFTSMAPICLYSVIMQLLCIFVVSCFRILVTVVLQHTARFDSRQVHVTFILDTVAVGQAFPTKTSVFPCRYHSAKAPYSLIHPLPTLNNLFVKQHIESYTHTRAHTHTHTHTHIYIYIYIYIYMDIQARHIA